MKLRFFWGGFGLAKMDMYVRIRVREEVIERVQRWIFFKHCKDKAGKMCKIIMSSLQKGSHHSTFQKKN